MRIKHFAAIPGLPEGVHGTGEPTTLFVVDESDGVWMMSDPNRIHCEWIQLPGLPLRVGEVRPDLLLERDHDTDRAAQREER